MIKISSFIIYLYYLYITNYLPSTIKLLELHPKYYYFFLRFESIHPFKSIWTPASESVWLPCICDHPEVVKIEKTFGVSKIKCTRLFLKKFPC